MTPTTPPALTMALKPIAVGFQNPHLIQTPATALTMARTPTTISAATTTKTDTKTDTDPV